MSFIEKRKSPRAGQTEANDMLRRLLELSDSDLRKALGIALKYSDHRSIAMASGMAAGKRLLIQLGFGLDEISQTLTEEEDYDTD